MTNSEYSIDKIIDLNNNNGFKDLSLKDNGLINCRHKLSEKQKNVFGYDFIDSVIDVVQGGYAITDGDDILFTYGIDPCCGVTLSNGERSILFHLDGSISPDEVIKITSVNGFDIDSNVIICPGASCGIPGSFQYQGLASLYKNMGYNVSIIRISATFGYVGVDGNKIRVGSSIIPENEVIIEGSNYRK